MRKINQLKNRKCEQINQDIHSGKLYMTVLWRWQ